MQQTAPVVVDGTDCDLMLYLQFKDDDQQSAHLALKMLMQRHHEYFINVAIKVLSCWPDLVGVRDVAEETVMDTWKKVYDLADSYSGAEVNDSDLSRKVFRAWAGTILRNLILDWLKLVRNKEKQNFTHHSLEEYEPQQVLLIQGEDAGAVEAKENQELFSCLSEKEADVIRELLLYLGTDLLTANLPQGAITEISERLNTQPENVRQLKSRAIRKIRAKYQDNFGSQQ